jgi:hypothetical protein
MADHSWAATTSVIQPKLRDVLPAKGRDADFPARVEALEITSASMSEADKEARGFKVTDRRSFTSDGDRRSSDESGDSEVQDSATEKQDSNGREESPPERPAPSDDVKGSSDPGPGTPPPVDFMALVNMLVTNALVQLGEMPDPLSGQPAENLNGARVMIDFLTVLQQKTKGNLDEGEAKILDDVLYDLRMRYMAKANLIQS